VKSWLTPEVLDRVEQGAPALLTDAAGVFPTLTASFKPAWWKGDDSNDHSYGNLFIDHPALRGFPAEGYGDLQAFGLLDGRPVVVLDDVPGGIEPIVWCLDVPWRMRRKAYLFEARVGKGRLLVSTMNLTRQARARDPAAEWMYALLTRYVAGPDFRPQAELPAEWLWERVNQSPMPDTATWVEGFARVIEYTGEDARWHSHREDDIRVYAVRQTDGSQRLTWETAPLPGNWPYPTATFAWAGGIGWRSQPDGGHFSLAVDGGPVLEFPFTTDSARWQTPDGAAALQYIVRRRTGEDTFGIFLLTVPARPGKPSRLTLTATAGNSRRWVSVVPYTDVVTSEVVEP